LDVEPIGERVERLLMPPRITRGILALALLLVIAGCQIQGSSVEAPKEPLTLIPRNRWTYETPIGGKMRPMGRITRITVHGLSPEEASLVPSQETPQMLREIRKAQMKKFRIGDIAYHYIIDRKGDIWKGRSIEFKGFNFASPDADKGNIGILIIGNFEEGVPTAAQVTSLGRLLEALAAKHRIGARFIFTHAELNRLYGLRETSCPGKNLSPIVRDIRKRLPRENEFKGESVPEFHYKGLR